MHAPLLALQGLRSRRPLSRIAIAVPDATRPMDLPAALRAYRALLGARWPAARVDVVVGLGLHRKLNDSERAPIEAAGGWPVTDHDPDDCADLGRVGDVPCLVNRTLLAAELVLAVGVVELHQYAGFSGGYKAVAVGCGGRQTLAALHDRALVLHPDVRVGRLAGNPFRERVDALGERIGLHFALQALPDGRWVGGSPREALAEAAAALDPWEEIDRRYSSVILRVPGAKAANFYQASRAATYLALSDRPPLEPGALLVLDARCPEGAGQGSGERAFAELLSAHPPPWQTVLDGDAPEGAGLQRAFMLARLAQNYRLVVAGCERPQELLALGIDATSLPAEAVAGPGALEIPHPFERLPQLRGARPQAGGPSAPP